MNPKNIKIPFNRQPNNSKNSDREIAPEASLSSSLSRGWSKLEGTKVSGAESSSPETGLAGEGASSELGLKLLGNPCP